MRTDPGTSTTYLATNMQALGGKMACAFFDVGCSPKWSGLGEKVVSSIRAGPLDILLLRLPGVKFWLCKSEEFRKGVTEADGVRRVGVPRDEDTVLLQDSVRLGLTVNGSS